MYELYLYVEDSTEETRNCHYKTIEVSLYVEDSTEEIDEELLPYAACLGRRCWLDQPLSRRLY
jgi:hypothetical protein